MASSWIGKMEEEVLELWKNRKLMDEDQKGSLLDVDFSIDLGKREKLCLLWFIVADKAVNQDAFRLTMQFVWRLQGKVNFKEVDQNRYIVEFQDTLYMERVEVGRPQSFNWYLL